jgi:hypothetical protein
MSPVLLQAASNVSSSMDWLLLDLNGRQWM